jgi:hypothetical protein
MKFNEHQKSLWHKMINLIEDFRKSKIQYTNLVYGLEGALYAGEFKDKIIVDQWYEFWTPLEIFSATKSNNTTILDIDEDLSKMEVFLKNKTFREDLFEL